MGHAVILNHPRMAHGKVCRALEFSDRIAPRAHYFADQVVRIFNRGARVIHKMRLLSPPRFGEACLFLVVESADLEFLHSLGTVP